MRILSGAAGFLIDPLDFNSQGRPSWIENLVNCQASMLSTILPRLCSRPPKMSFPFMPRPVHLIAVNEYGCLDLEKLVRQRVKNTPGRGRLISSMFLLKSIFNVGALRRIRSRHCTNRSSVLVCVFKHSCFPCNLRFRTIRSSRLSLYLSEHAIRNAPAQSGNTE
jgi:hypothetical protein